MELVQVRITSTVITQHYGTLMPGTILRTNAAYAKHLVEEASAAKYLIKIDFQNVDSPTEPEPEAAKPPKRKKAAEADAIAEDPPAQPADEAKTEQLQ